MTTLAQQMAADLPAFFSTDEHAVPAIYTPDGGSPVSISVVMDYEGNPEASPGAVMASATAWVRAADVALPAYRDVLTVHGLDWTVAQVSQGDGLVWQLSLRRDRRPTLRR